MPESLLSGAVTADWGPLLGCEHTRRASFASARCASRLALARLAAGTNGHPDTVAPAGALSRRRRTNRSHRAWLADQSAVLPQESVSAASPEGRPRVA